MNLNAWAYVAIAVIFIGYSYWLVDIGYSGCQAEQLTAEKAQLKDDSDYIENVYRIKEKAREKIVIKWKTRIIKDENCYMLTDALPVDHINELRRTHDTIKGSSSDRGLSLSSNP